MFRLFFSVTLLVGTLFAEGLNFDFSPYRHEIVDILQDGEGDDVETILALEDGTGWEVKVCPCHQGNEEKEKLSQWKVGDKVSLHPKKNRKTMRANNALFAENLTQGSADLFKVEPLGVVNTETAKNAYTFDEPTENADGTLKISLNSGAFFWVLPVAVVPIDDQMDDAMPEGKQMPEMAKSEEKPVEEEMPGFTAAPALETQKHEERHMLHNREIIGSWHSGDRIFFDAFTGKDGKEFVVLYNVDTAEDDEVRNWLVLPYINQ